MSGDMSEHAFAAVGFFHDPVSRQILLHFRSADAPTNPSLWAFFGGTAEAGESPVECFCREIYEELGIRLDPSRPRELWSYRNPRSNRFRHVFVVEGFVPTREIVLNEGAGFAWIPIDKVDAYELTPSTRRDLHRFFTSTGIS